MIAIMAAIAPKRTTSGKSPQLCQGSCFLFIIAYLTLVIWMGKAKPCLCYIGQIVSAPRKQVEIYPTFVLDSCIAKAVKLQQIKISLSIIRQKGILGSS